jgi:flagellar protein FliO/FliZ
VLLIIVFVILLAYYSLKMMAFTRAGGRLGNAKANLSIVESIGVGANSMVQIVRAGEKYYLLGVTKERITMLAELDETKMDLSEIKKMPEMPFGKIFNKFLKRESSAKDDGTRDNES